MNVNTISEAKHTPLYEWHLSQGAKMTPFAGWMLPLSYTSQIEEHKATRTSVGIFDVSHMGEIIVRGAGAADFCDWLLPNKVKKLIAGEQANYHPMCRADGTVVDDLFLYYLAPDEIFICTNAANTAKDDAFIRAQAAAYGFMGDIQNASDAYAQIAVQGPRARALVARAYPEWGVDQLKRFRFVRPRGDLSWIVSRTGYTGEDGVEIYCPAGEARETVERMTAAARADDVQWRPAGLGARDTLRLEMGYSLYGHELDDAHTAIESGLGFFCDFEKGDFCGREALYEQQTNPSRAREMIVGFYTPSRRAPRVGHSIVDARGETVGRVVSGAFGPSVGVGICTAFVASAVALGEGGLAGARAVGPQGELPLTVCAFPFTKNISTADKK